MRSRASTGRQQAHKKGENKQKGLATVSRRATPVARERNPTTSLAQERVPCHNGIGSSNFHAQRLLRRDAAYTIRAAAHHYM